MQYYILNMEQLYHIPHIETVAPAQPEQEERIPFQLLYVQNGRLQATVSGETVLASRDSLLFLPTQMPYTLTPVSSDTEVIRIEFTSAGVPSEDNRLCPEEEFFEHLRYFAFDGVQERWAHIPLVAEPSTGFACRSLIEQLCDNFYAAAPGTNLLAMSQLHQLLARISADSAAASLSQEHRDSGCSSVIHSVCEYLNAHYTQKITLSELSDYFHLSSNYLCSLFKETTGLSIVDYVNGRRLETAKSYLVNTDCRIQDVARAVGIADEFYFCRLFKKQCGYTPSAFRRHFRTVNGSGK